MARMPLRRTLARTALALGRWRTVGTVPRSGIIVGAPHTSNWDWVAMLAMLWSQEVPPRVLIKKEMFRGPLGPVLRATGGIPVDRAHAAGAVRDLVARAKEDDSFLIVLAAEGSRSPGSHWKSGFYRLAQLTGLPVALGFIDGPSRTLGFGPTLHVTGVVGDDMDRVRAFYADKRGIRPDRRNEPRLREEDRVPPAPGEVSDGG